MACSTAERQARLIADALLRTRAEARSTRPGSDLKKGRPTVPAVATTCPLPRSLPSWARFRYNHNHNKEEF